MKLKLSGETQVMTFVLSTPMAKPKFSGNSGCAVILIQDSEVLDSRRKTVGDRLLRFADFTS